MKKGRKSANVLIVVRDDRRVGRGAERRERKKKTDPPIKVSLPCAM